MNAFIYLFLLPCSFFLLGCGSDNKPNDQDKLQQEFNDLQKARQKEDPFAGKRK